MVETDGAVTLILRDIIETGLPAGARLQGLLDLWCARRAGGRVPRRADLPFEDLKPWLGRIMLVEPIEGADDFRYRLFGTEVARELGRDLTGHSIRTFGDTLGDVFVDVSREAFRDAQPIYLHYDPPETMSFRRRSVLVLPLGEGDVVTMLLVASVFGA